MTATIMPLGAAGIWLEERRRTSHRNKENSLNRSWDKRKPLDILEIRKRFSWTAKQALKSEVSRTMHCMGCCKESEENCGSPFNVFPYFPSAAVSVWVCVSVFERTTTAVTCGEFAQPLCRLQNSPLSLFALPLTIPLSFSSLGHLGKFSPILSTTFFLSHFSLCVGDTFFELQFVSVVFCFWWLKLK